MAVSFPRMRLYASNGSTLIYEFENVLNWDPDPFQDPSTFVEHESLRGQGSIISNGSNASWDFSLEFYLKADGYEALMALKKAIRDTIIKNTKYILKIDLTSGGSTIDLKVKRLVTISFPITGDKKATDSRRGTIQFKVDCWA